MENGKTYIGIDFGGTTIHGGLVRDDKILKQSMVKTGNNRPAEDIFESITGLIKELAEGCDIDGIGVGVPVPAGPDSDVLKDAVNIESMEGFPLKRRLAERFSLPVLLENDARCMVLGEYMAGALQGYPDCACITLGTGLGCGLIVDGSIYRGAKYWGGEIWNIPYGDSGASFEYMSSISGLETLFIALGGDELDPEAMYARFKEGDKIAANAFELYGERIGRIIATVFCMLDPGMIAVGGGLSRAYDAFSGSMMKIVKESVGERAIGRVVRAALIEDAAIIGAASLFV